MTYFGIVEQTQNNCGRKNCQMSHLLCRVGDPQFENRLLTAQKNKTIFLIFSSPSEDIDKYDGRGVHLAGWGSKEKTGAISNHLRRVQINVFPMR
jgi:hypothetical protein